MTRKPHKARPAQPYQYEELPHDGSFRYIILHRGTGNDPLKCSLQAAPLGKTTFEAISYVWGKSKKNKKIICDGRVIRITKSLSNVLRRLRLPHKRRKLWADGICINQDDLEEKGHQVAIMGDIYRSAKCVLIYIGSEDYGDGPLVCSLLDDVNRMIDETCKHIDTSQGAFPFVQDDDTLRSDSRWISLLNLFRQSWFRRGWVVREAASAHYGLVIWHNSEFSWEKLMRLYIWLLMRGGGIYGKFDFYKGTVWSHAQAFREKEKAIVETICTEYEWPTQSLLSQLSTGKTLQLSDARDRVYAFMELSGNFKRVFIMNPDYHLAPLEVYHQFAVTYIQETNDITILDHVCHDYEWNRKIDDIPFVDIPSWIPRWDVRRWSLSAKGILRWRRASARDGSIHEPKIIDSCILSARGVIVDSVLYASDIFPVDEEEMQQILDDVWGVISQTLNTSPYGTSHIIEAFLDCLSLGRSGGNAEYWLRSRDTFITHRKAACHDGLASGDTAHDDDVSSSARIVWNYFKSYILGKRFIFTRRGYMGLAPDVTKEDDSCAIIFGCRLPCILRQTGRKQQYKYIGSTWLLGSHSYEGDGEPIFWYPLGHDYSKEWVNWDVEEQDIYLE
ncbi:heterokaryon incompatibility protein-domain-containing protein [Alternaria rosae]|uniref:heterokaryon incompatibility protein-domain-containing protein n=1 Tax=Alternaria rosae TaxID=1187941 RepID=UPI001E8ED822|nr:heterokaryon incompatibility protein-domain-containing protein [Alternaria rosae]KAH6866447.1 heterokaryon incompatibility protein-domain-containing protein [Alternaria rosae]